VARDLRPAESDHLLKSLGFAEPDLSQPALSALHAGAAYHRLAVIIDVVAAYARDANLPPGEPVYFERLRQVQLNGEPRVTAESYYREAIKRDSRLAEARFNLGRLLQDSGDREQALDCFNRCTSLPPHSRAQPHAFLHANAHWHAATILEDLGRDDEALTRYRDAVALCENFGVHHARFARFLRRRGLLSEAVVQYERLMTYSHRYFTEFVLPSLQPSASPSSAQPLDILYETTEGSAIVFLGNEYCRLPRGGRYLVGATLTLRMKLRQLEFRTSQGFLAARMLQLITRYFESRVVKSVVDRAHSIAEFEKQ
jgi:tetratricopeptide (TPR) repeat protein